MQNHPIIVILIKQEFCIHLSEYNIKLKIYQLFYYFHVDQQKCVILRTNLLEEE